MSRLLLLLVPLWLPLSLSHNHCPVTSRYNVAENGYLPFPSLYWPDQSTPRNNEEYYNCSVRPKYGPSKIGICMPQRPCLVSSEQLLAALGTQTWIPAMHAICSLAEQIHISSKNPKKSPLPRYSLNLIFIGGSMTQGAATDGECLCIHSEDERCAEIDRSKVPYSFCSWVTQFVNWIRAEFPMVQFNVSDLSQSGVASVIVPDHIDPFFRHLNFSDNDLIFIDESVNDAGRQFADLKQDVESMFRRLFAATRGSFPTIVMIEQFPHRNYFDGLRRQGTFEHHILPGDYSLIYRNLSQHYGFVFYSLREVYWTYFNQALPQDHRYAFTPFDDWHYNTHPPWYFHNYMADVVADCFLYSLSRCRKLSVSNPGAVPRYVLPPPYYVLSTEEYCNPSVPYRLDAHAMNYFHPENLREFEEGETAKQAGWREYTDYHNTSGWIINSLSDPSKRDLSFPLTGPQGAGFGDLLVVVVFLRSYVGMGMAEVIVCGLSNHLWLDGLYKDYRTNRVSMPTMVSFEILREQQEACRQLSEKDRTLVIRYHVDADQQAHDEVRHHKKVKVMSVEVCSKVKQ